ncbi:MAG: hypothetical protein JNL61_13735 [Rhizobiaceae bacterium]|nr:hypothetical protein [Rhizobiaceae bacterium]
MAGHGKRRVKMMAAQAWAFALMVGITVAGLAGTILELAARRPVSFAEPFLSRARPLRSLFAAMLAGPLMLGNDALDAWRRSRISAWQLASSATVAFAWALATGIAVLGAVARTFPG